MAFYFVNFILDTIVYSNLVYQQPTDQRTGDASGSVPAATKSSECKFDKSCFINFNNMEAGSMEFLTVGAAVAAKDKRIKDAKNQAAMNKDKETQTTATQLLPISECTTIQ